MPQPSHMSDRNQTDMAPDSHIDSAGPVQLIASMTITSHGSSSPTAHHHHHHHQPNPAESRVLTTSPLPNGILFKGKKMKKRVSFRDSELVRIREIPPRPCSGDEESDDEEVPSSSDSEEDTESDSEEEEAPSPQPPPPPPPSAPAVVNGPDKPVTTSPVTRTTPVVTLTVNRAPVPVTQSVSRTPPSTLVSAPMVRPERAPIPWTPASTFTGTKASCNTAVSPAGAKGPYNTTVSPAAKAISLVSRITGVSSSTTQIHTRPRSAVVSSAPATSQSSARKSPSPVPPKKSPTVVRGEKKVKKITPTLDNVMTSQTVRSVQKHGAVSESLHKGSSGKTSKKKRVSRRQEGNDKRKTTPSRKTKDSKQTNNNSKASDNSAASRQTVSAKRNVSSAGARPKSVVNGLGSVRDSLSLPPLSSDDSVLLNPTKLLQQRPTAKTPVYSVDGFVFPGDPTHDLTINLKTAATSPAEDVKLKLQGPSAASGYPGRDQHPGHTPVRERVSSAPASSISRRKRFYAWQMANGNLQNSLHEPPSITPMWENITSVSTPTPKPAYVTDR